MAGKTGRPSDYTPELGELICALLAEGISLRTVCLDDDMPDKSTVFRWLRIHEPFRDQYAIAKAEAADALVEEMLDIADDGSNDWMKRHGKGEEESWVHNGESTQRSRLRIDTRKWIASKLKPKKFGDQLALTGGDGGPLTIEIVKYGEDKTPA